MKNKPNIYNEGFTLTELLVNILIVSVVTVSMFMVFFEVNRHTDLEYNKEEIRQYANLYLDLIAKDLRRTQALSVNKRFIANGGSRTRINTDNNRFIVDTLTGIMRDELQNDGSMKKDITDYLYEPIDPESGTEKFKIANFEINEVSATLGVNLSSEAQSARNASKEITMEVLLYSKEQQSKPYDTLRFTRRVFCPGLLISENNENS